MHKPLRLIPALICLLSAAALAIADDRVQLRLDASEAEAVLAIIQKHASGGAIADADWQQLFSTEPYARLKRREASLHRDFTDDDFKRFVLSAGLAG